ncbi:MAG: DinB family protein [Anaerolineae bacterium]|nr:DinB family protein [Anaerolineae bacterium]
MTTPTVEERIATIRDFVPRLRDLIDGLNDEQVTTQYNAPEWTIAQNVHHLADAHMHAFLRCKQILTQDEAQLFGWNPSEYAKEPDAMDANVELSLKILEGIHARWTTMFENVTDWDKSGWHTGANKHISLDTHLSTYSRHGDAHYRQIQEVLEKMP